ncbi:hypothetical protein [Salinibacter ruber]|uniref:hypothetical protein n=1 Tax=Salinibacter ruber TaxID=146919 RepID=UPI002074110D|nr:hypothetical protein [Salinibacter ruber]MCS3785459.1 putative nucleic acid-binding Zn-ribbon protein [Salinibacter ruber]
MSLREEMDGAAEKGEQVEKNREQAEENREKIEGLENTLENMMEEIAEEVEGLRSDLSKKIVRAEEATEEVNGEVEKAIKAINQMRSEGIELEGLSEVEDLREKLSRYLKLVDLEKSGAKSADDLLQRVRERLIEVEEQAKEKNEEIAKGAKKAKSGGERAYTVAKWAPVLGVVGGLVGFLMQAGLTWVGYPVLPQEVRMSPGEIDRVMRDRRVERAVDQMTEKELKDFRSLLQEAEKKTGESSRPQD